MSSLRTDDPGAASPPDSPEPPRAPPRTIRAWILYDFANSIYPAVVTTAVFPTFYRSAVVGEEGGLGDLWWGLAVAASALTVALTSPFLGAFADRSGRRKRFLGAGVGLCLIGLGFMTTLGSGMVIAGFVIFVVTNFGFEIANVFYNAYLPDIVPRAQLGRTSGHGFAAGYLGSALGLLLVLPLVGRIELVWLVVAVFFLVFAIPAFLYLPPDRGAPPVRAATRGSPTETLPESPPAPFSRGEAGEAAATGSLRDLLRIGAEVWRDRALRQFLFAYFFYIDGVLTVIVMAAVIAQGTFNFTQEQVILLFLIVQFSALIGAFALARPTDSLGPKRVLTCVLLLWTIAAIAAFFVQSPITFYILAVGVGLGLGVVQSASRAFMASLIPAGREAALFGFYALCGKSSSVLGPLLFGGVTFLAGGNQRPGFLVLAALFLIGLVLLQPVRDPKAPALRPAQSRPRVA